MLTTVFLIFAGLNVAQAQCPLPYKLLNGQTPDATQMMANFNALVTCLNAGGSSNTIQYNAGSGSLGGVGPLTNGQVVAGSTGNPPQAATLTAGSGIAITNGAGSVTVAATVGTVGTGLYRQVMSPTPTSASTGLSNWLNQGSSVVSDSAVGLCVDAPPAAGTNISGRYVAAPNAPYTITALIASTRNSTSNSSVGIGWYDGTAKLHVISYQTASAPSTLLQVWKYNSPTSANGTNFSSASNSFSQPVWMQIKDDGTNVSFAFSYDGANFLPVFSTTKSAGFLGATGYTNLIFFVNPQPGGFHTLGALLSWTQS